MGACLHQGVIVLLLAYIRIPILKIFEDQFDYH